MWSDFPGTKEYKESKNKKTGSELKFSDPCGKITHFQVF